MTKSESLGNVVAFMDSMDIGQLFVPGSKREMSALVPDYSQDEDGVDSVKVLMATPNLIMFEAFRPAGKIDRMHMHKDHHSVAYQKEGKVRMSIGSDTFVVEAGDTYHHPMGVRHQHESLEDSVRIEFKFYPDGNAIESWNRLVGGSLAE